MVGAQVYIWHHARLFGESLEHALAAKKMLRCKWIDSSGSLSPDAPWLNESCELLLLDAAAPAGDMAEVVVQMRRHWPQCKLMLLVPDSATERLVGLTQLGTQGCVRDGTSIDELCMAIQLLLDGKSYFSPELANALFAQLNGCDQNASWLPYAEAHQLTAREREVLRLIAWENLSNKQIAKRLHVSLYTVKNHVHNIIEKLDVEDRHGAAQLAQRRNLISVDKAM
jgi:DNA-binding NarL/FixJ family response regulator